MASIPQSSDPTTPVRLTRAGGESRDIAVAALNTRYRTLLDRSKRRTLSAGERSEIVGLERAIGELTAMEAAEA